MSAIDQLLIREYRTKAQLIHQTRLAAEAVNHAAPFGNQTTDDPIPPPRVNRRPAFRVVPDPRTPVTTPDLTQVVPTPDIATQDVVTPDAVTHDIATQDVVTQDIATPDVPTPDAVTQEVTPDQAPCPGNVAAVEGTGWKATGDEVPSRRYPAGIVPVQQDADPSSPIDSQALSSSISTMAPEPPCPGETAEESPSQAGAAAADTTTADVPVLGEFRIPWEVERFRWPTICQRLTKRTSGELDEIIATWQARAAIAPAVWLVTSLAEGEGCTTLTLTLGRRAAGHGLRTLLVDADGAQADMSRRLGVAPAVSLPQILSGEQPVAEGCIRSFQDRVCLLANSVQEHTLPVARSLASAVAEIAAQFQIILVDAGSLATGVTAEMLGAWPRGAAREIGLVVIRDVRRTHEEQVREALRSFADSAARSMDVIENFVAHDG